MLAAVTAGPGGPIQVEDIPIPEPRPGEVLVRVHAASVNRLDRAVFDGFGLSGVAKFPLIQGIDAAGVLETGGGSLIAGRRVVVKPATNCRTCRYCKAGRDAECDNATMLGVHRPGGFAEYVAVPRTSVHYLPSDLSFAQGAAAAHTHPVALRMMRVASEPGPGDTVLVTGAAGALGTACIQLAGTFGARVIAVASTEAKVAVAKVIGATDAVVSGPDGAFAAAVGKLTEGTGADLVLDTTGSSDVIAEGVSTMARGGRLVVVAAKPHDTLQLDLHSLYRERQAVMGSAGSSGNDFTDAFRMLKDHHVRPVVAATYQLEDAAAAMDHVLDRSRIGKVVIEMGASS